MKFKNSIYTVEQNLPNQRTTHEQHENYNSRDPQGRVLYNSYDLRALLEQSSNLLRGNYERNLDLY